MPRNAVLSLLTLALLAGCSSMPSAEKLATATDEARATADGLIKTLGGELQGALKAGGAAEAISVCKAKAPQVAAAAAEKSGFQIKRVSPKNRNPKAVPDAWETDAQAALEARLAAGEKPETLDMTAVVDAPDGKGKVFRYAKALVTLPVCTACHGPADSIAEDVKARLAAEYPQDKAIGYVPGKIRGILSMKKPL
jgi:hypothetical protein